MWATKRCVRNTLTDKLSLPPWWWHCRFANSLHYWRGFVIVGVCITAFFFNRLVSSEYLSCTCLSNWSSAILSVTFPVTNYYTPRILLIGCSFSCLYHLCLLPVIFSTTWCSLYWSSRMPILALIIMSHVHFNTPSSSPLVSSVLQQASVLMTYL